MKTPADSYSHATSGLLKKRGELVNELDRCFARIAELRNDIAATNRVLRAFGYDGELVDKAGPQRKVMFEKGQLGRAIMDELRMAGEPQTTNQLATALIRRFKQDPRDKALLREYVERTSNAMQKLRTKGLVDGAKNGSGGMVWRVFS
jgi:hypothetical protein